MQKRKKYSQAARMHDLLRLLESRHGLTIDEIAEETGVNRRTVHRDLNALHDAGYPLVSEWEEGRKLYRLMHGFREIPPITFTLQELLTLSLLRSQAAGFQGTPFQERLDTIFRKINSVLPPRYVPHMERIAQVSLPLLAGTRDYSRCAASLDPLMEALLYQYRIRLRYLRRGEEEAEYDLDPYTLVFHKGGLYLLAFALNRKAVRTFAVDRIVSIEVTRERFEIPPEYDPQTRFRESFGIAEEPPTVVSVRFDRLVAPSIRERQWHPSQQLREQPDGSIVLTFNAGGRLEILSWVLSFGASAEILSPCDLREEAARILRDASARYEKR